MKKLIFFLILMLSLPASAQIPAAPPVTGAAGGQAALQPYRASELQITTFEALSRAQITAQVNLWLRTNPDKTVVLVQVSIGSATYAVFGSEAVRFTYLATILWAQRSPRPVTGLARPLVGLQP